MTNNIRTFWQASTVVAYILWFILSNAAMAQAVRPAPDPDRSQVRLDQFAEVLIEEYGTVITYEDPLWLWRGGLREMGRSTTLRPIRPTFAIPDEIDRIGSGKLDANIVGRAIGLFNGQNPQAPHYRVITSKLGLHFVPFEAHNSAGTLVPAESILGVRISIPREYRTPSEHLALLCAAVEKATGVRVENNGLYSFDNHFGANGYMLSKLATITQRVRQYLLIHWGAEGISARDALINLLEASCTTMTWSLFCIPGTASSNASCALNLLPLTVNRRSELPPRVTVFFDRCTERNSIPLN